MRLQHRVLFIRVHPDHTAGAGRRQVFQRGVARGQHGRAAGAHAAQLGRQHAALHGGVGAGFGLDDGQVALRVGPAVLHGGVQVLGNHRGRDGAVHQHALAGRGGWAGGRQHALGLQVHGIAAGHARGVALGLLPDGQGLRDAQAGVGLGQDAGHGNAAVGRVREQVGADGLAHGARLAVHGVQVHQQAGAGVDFDDGAALLQHGLADVLQHHVDAGNVQADGARRHDGVVGHVGVDFVGAVHGQVAGAQQQHFLAGGGHGFRLQLLALQLDQDLGVLRQLDALQRHVHQAAWVLVDLGFHQLGHGGLAVADHAQGLAARGRHHLVADHQHAVLMATDAALHQHLGAFALGQLPGGFDRGLVHQVQADAARAVAIQRLDHHRHAQALGDLPGLGRRCGQVALGRGNAGIGQQALGQGLVRGDVLGDGPGLVALGRPDALLRRPHAQLHQVALGEQAVGGQVALQGGVGDAGGAGAQAFLIDHEADAGQRRSPFDRALCGGQGQQFQGLLQHAAAQGGLAGLQHDGAAPVGLGVAFAHAVRQGHGLQQGVQQLFELGPQGRLHVEQLGLQHRVRAPQVVARPVAGAQDVGLLAVVHFLDVRDRGVEDAHKQAFRV